MVTVLENCRVSPPPETTAEKSLPLTFFDLIWIPFHPLGRVIFFNIPCSTQEFTQNIVPHLKTSLSLALKHFSPLAGNLIKPLHNNSNSDFHILYVEGDSVSVTTAECTGDFDHFTGNHARDADILRPLVPQLQSGGTCVQVSGEDCSADPLLAIQVTVFPNHGVSFGITNSHVVADGSSLFNFIQAWASFAKQLMANVDVADSLTSPEGSDFRIPFYDRSSVKDPLGLGPIFKNMFTGSDVAEQMEKTAPDHSAVSGEKKARATFVLKQADIAALKNSVMTKRPTLPYVSSFSVVCAYIWSCMAKTRAVVAGELEEEPLNFGISYDCRARLDPPVPATYFGNCLLAVMVGEKRKLLVGEEGLFTAAELIGKALDAKLNDPEGVMKGAQHFPQELAEIMRGDWYLGIAGSPRLDYYNTLDFGWGKPRKFEFVSEPCSVSRLKDSKTDLELGIILPKNEMDVFSSIFAKELKVPT